MELRARCCRHDQPAHELLELVTLELDGLRERPASAEITDEVGVGSEHRRRARRVPIGERREGATQNHDGSSPASSRSWPRRILVRDVDRLRRLREVQDDVQTVRARMTDWIDNA